MAGDVFERSVSRLLVHCKQCEQYHQARHSEHPFCSSTHNMGSTCSKDAAVAQQSRAANAAPLPATLAKTSSAQRIPDKIVSMAALAPKERVVRYEYPVKPQAALDVDIHVTYNGVCASDVHMIDNNWGMSRYPLVPGHEVVGRVIAVGNAVKDLKVGDVVGLGCLAQKCDHCEWCEKKLDNLCPERKFTYFSTTVDETGEHVHHGGFSSFIRTDARGLFKIPDGYSEAHAGPLMCAGITVGAPLYEFCGNSFNGSGKRIAVVGLGGLGHLAVMFAVKMGAEVTVISRGESKRQFALELGAHRFIDSGNAEQMKAAAASVDLLLVCISGGKFDVMSYVGLMRPYGHIHLVGIPEEDLSLNIQAFVFQRLSLSGSPIGSSEQMRAMLAFAGKHNIKPIIEVFPHSRANEAIQKVRDNTIRFRAVLQNDLA